MGMLSIKAGGMTMTMKKKSLVTKEAAAKTKGNSTTNVEISKPTAVKVVSAKSLSSACVTGKHIASGTITC
jgi:hypothetical protein